ncbi:glycoside hydrolase family 2 TIM barrel-domain containing protein [Flavobacterium rhizosphaerae]|uniref:Glycoside hydrolase family 2 TIM barrel-domain containing protein n=1 Tax=Flavobacterium rhizosphaerae TaxID=3163298 RepID=A0ABW8YUC7_9FLAO
MIIKYSPYFTKTIGFVFIITLIACSSKSNNSFTAKRKADFNQSWQFHLNAGINNNDSINSNTKWRTLNLPHDWSIEGRFKQDSPAGIGGGALDGGIGWYKKIFSIPKQDSTKITSITFDGVYANSSVWINGHYLGTRPNGYIGFTYNLTPYLQYGDRTTNEILVKADNAKQPNSRWYSGSGIYRNVWLNTTDKLHVAENGTFITTPFISAEKATIKLQAVIKNEYTQEKEVTVNTVIYKGETMIDAITHEQNIGADTEFVINQSVTIKNPVLWNIEKPELYRAVTSVNINGNLTDEYETKFGIREFKFDLDKGFILNGKQFKIKGVCLHHDLGPLGAAFNTHAMERELRIMKNMGVNSIRTSHNAPAPQLLDLCDEMGILVMDEAFDMWEQAKTEYDYSNYWEKWHKKDLEDQILRDRNHPSVFVWSIGNEIPEQWSNKGAEIGRELSAIVKKLDSTRPITAAMNPPIAVNPDEAGIQFKNTADKPNNLAASGALNIIGYNYAHQTWPRHRINFPETPFIATETTSALQTRGYYDEKSDVEKNWPVRWDIPFYDGNTGNTVSAYDQTHAPWGSTHEESWKIIKKHEFLSGMYIWTGFDYIGEPTPYQWPSISSYFGVADLAGFPKDVYYMYQSEWTDKNVLHIFPHWNWTKGKEVDIWAYYNNADEVELYLNGKSLGKKRKQGDNLHIMWRVTYEPGSLKAVSRKDGKVILEREIKTSGPAAGLKATADREAIAADGYDLSYITINVTDTNGIFVPTANNQISFTLKGDGKIIGVCSGDPVSHEPYKAQKHTAWMGKCLVIIQSGKKAGKLQLSASSPGLKPASVSIITK